MIQKTKKILDELNIDYVWKKHESIMNYEDAMKVDKELGFTGIETKNLFLKNSQNSFFVFLTTFNVRFDKKIIKEKINQKLSIAPEEELIKKTGYIPGSAASFPYDIDVTYIVDNRIFKTNKLICSGGTPTESYEMETKYLQKILDFLPNKKIYIDFD